MQNNHQSLIDDLNKYTVAIKDRETGEPHGTGIIVTDDGLILTCYHVIGNNQDERFYYKDTIGIYFPEASVTKAAYIEENYCNSRSDIALLRLRKGEQLPSQTRVAPLSESVLYGHKFASIGFRKSSQFKKLDASGEIRIKTALQNDEDDKESSVSIIKIYSDEIEEGMSGAPVLDLITNRVVGIISLHYPAKNNSVDTKLNFAIPVESIIKVCPTIKEKNPGLKILEDNLVNNADPVHKRYYHTFLSRAYVDKITADNIYEWLRVAVRDAEGNDHIYYDKPDLGVNKSALLSDVIPKCRSIIILLSKDSVSKGWVREEYNTAISHKALFNDFKIIPVLIEEYDVREFPDTESLIVLGEGRLDLDTSKEILERMYFHQRIGSGPSQVMDVYVSRGWKEREQPFADYICDLLDKVGFRLIGDAEDQKEYDVNRIKSIMSSCGGHIAIVPDRGHGDTSQYILDEIDIAQQMKIPCLIIAEPKVYLPKKLAKFSIRLDMDTSKSSVGRSTLQEEINKIKEEWKNPGKNRHYIFFATDLDKNGRREIIRDHIELITSMICKMAPDYKDKLRETITESITYAYLVIADISENNPNTLIEAGIALGARRNLRMVVRKSSTDKENEPPYMLNNTQIEPYADDKELLQKVHRIAYEFRRRVLNYELGQ